jgi:Cellulose biosynthesis protein BcsS
VLQLRNTRAVASAVIAALVLDCQSAPAAAAGKDAADHVAEDHDDDEIGSTAREFWMGADAGARNWLVYAGTTFAPSGDIHSDGWRLRTVATHGRYDYNWDVKTKVKVARTTSDTLIGYQMRFGELTAKVFGGYAYMLSIYDLPAYSIRTQKTNAGAKGALELWLNLGSTAWTSLDMSYAQPRDSISIRSRTGYRVFPKLSIGPEAIFNYSDLTGEVQEHADRLRGNTRIGLFVRQEWEGGEISASGGLSGDLVERKSGGEPYDLLHAPKLYGTLNLVVQF